MLYVKGGKGKSVKTLKSSSGRLYGNGEQYLLSISEWKI